MSKATTIPTDRPALWAIALLTSSIGFAALSVFLLAVG